MRADTFWTPPSQYPYMESSAVDHSPNSSSHASLSDRARSTNPPHSSGEKIDPTQSASNAANSTSAPAQGWQQRRWYDREPQAARAIRYLLAFPVVFQDVVCQTLLSIAAQLPSDALEPLKSLGTENILALYKAKQKRRDYDQRALTHDTFSQLGSLPNAKRLTMTRHIHHLTDAFRGYLKLCKHYQARPNLIEVRKLLSQYQTSGTPACESLLQEFKDQWEHQKLLKTSNLAFMNTPRVPAVSHRFQANPHHGQSEG